MWRRSRVHALPMTLFALAAAASCSHTAPTSESLVASESEGADTTWDTSPDVEARADALLARMSLDQKVDLVTGKLEFGIGNNAIEELGIPPLSMTNGPAGLQVDNPGVNARRATAFPSATAMGATFDPDLVSQAADTIASEARSMGNNVLLAPSLDVIRTPLWGRAFESYAEDSLLIARMGTAFVRAVQTRPMIATLKHWAVYNQETQRFTVDAKVDERALQQIYLAPFEAVVRDAHPGSVMCSFNRVNGVQSCENDLMTSSLKGGMGFRGFVMSDYAATASTAPAANAGLDMELPGDQGPGTARFGDPLRQAVDAGQVRQDRLDDMARRILRAMIGLGLLESPPRLTLPFDEAAHGKVARSVAEKSVVLLKNAGVLPLDASAATSIAVIGPDADDVSATGGGSAHVTPTYEVSPLKGLQDRFPNAKIAYEAGVDGISEAAMLPGPAAVPSSLFSTDEGQPGLHAQYWTNLDFTGSPAVDRTDPQVNMNFGFFNYENFNASSPKIPSITGRNELTQDISARWTGTIAAPSSGDYALSLTARGTAKLFIDDQNVLEHEGGDLSTVTATVPLEQGKGRKIRVEYSATAKDPFTGGQVKLGWAHADEVMSPAMQRAVDLARTSDVAVIFARDYESEGQDRPSLELPGDQAALIRNVGKVNPRTIVVLETGSATLVGSFEDSAQAILQAWYPGQEQGHALAAILSGDVNPSGKLPLTIPVDDTRTPTSSKEQFPGVGPEGSEVATYLEGVGVGYRGYDRLAITPRFPFGFGLSYTSFQYGEVIVTPDMPSDRDVIHVKFHVTNTGARSGEEVAQVYLQLPPRLLDPKRLVGFARVALAPGESKEVDVAIDPASLPRPLATWDLATKTWVNATGGAVIYVGGSSLALRLVAPITLVAP